MAQKPNKTTENDNSVDDFVSGIANEKRRSDFAAIIGLFAENSGFRPKMWGPAIVGFGSYHYKYESGREGDAPLAGLASRANSITLYFGTSFENREELLSKFGKHKISGGCIHIQKLEDIDTAVLGVMVKNSVAHQKLQYPDWH